MQYGSVTSLRLFAFSDLNRIELCTFWKSVTPTMQIMKTILIIEDTEPILDNLTEYFEMEGFKIIGARNGKIGIELAEALTPDLIICDVLMPEMDGYQVLDALMHRAKTFEIPFIFSTSMSEIGNIEQGLKHGADDYIIKPFDLEDLLKMANSWINSGSLRHQASRKEMIAGPSQRQTH